MHAHHLPLVGGWILRDDSDGWMGHAGSTWPAPAGPKRWMQLLVFPHRWGQGIATSLVRVVSERQKKKKKEHHLYTDMHASKRVYLPVAFANELSIRSILTTHRFFLIRSLPA